jgi:antitoxin component of RelBE/YafQ-DinJ toxin-antitoxin module
MGAEVKEKERTTKNPSEVVNWRLDEALLARAREEARRRGLAITAFVNLLISDYFDKKSVL